MAGTAAPPSPARPQAPWARTAERGSLFMLRLMAWIALRLGRGAARAVLHPITLYFLCFAPQARRHSRRYLARALGRAPGWRDGYRHMHTFASTVLDRVYFASGQTHRFELHVSGDEHVLAALHSARPGAVLLGAHVGSFESLHAMSRQALAAAGHAAPRVVMAMYPDNARMIHAVLQALAPGVELPVIALGSSTATLAMREALDGGALLALLADRSVREPGRGQVALPFLGAEAPFSDGPLRLAMLLRRRVFFMAGVYDGGRRYRLHFEPLADFGAPQFDGASRGERERHVHEALRRYVACLERTCRDAPYNGFNFFDFWREDNSP